MLTSNVIPNEHIFKRSPSTEFLGDYFWKITNGKERIAFIYKSGHVTTFANDRADKVRIPFASFEEALAYVEAYYLLV